MGELIGNGNLTKNGLMPLGQSFRTYTGLLAASSYALCNDFNKIHEAVDMGLSVFRVESTALNIPAIDAGVLTHWQRDSKGSVTASQVIGQQFFGTKNIYIRRAQGNGSTITWDEWKLL